MENLNVTLIYQLYPIITVVISQMSVEWIRGYQVAYIWGNLIQITHFPHIAHLKKVIGINHNIEGCKNLDQCGSKLPIFPKGVFFWQS